MKFDIMCENFLRLIFNFSRKMQNLKKQFLSFLLGVQESNPPHYLNAYMHSNMYEI
jgi:hypothetical protein